MTIIQLYTYTLLKYSHSLHNKGQEDKKFDYLYLKKFKKVKMSMKPSNRVGSFVRNSSPRVRPISPSSENVFNVRKSSLPPYLRKKCIVQGPVFQKVVKLIQYLG